MTRDRLVSVITPVHGESVNYLGEAYESLRAQVLPDGWVWEWLVQEDGESGDVERRLPHDARVIGGRGRHGGPGVARTLALARSRGNLIKVLDADDQLAPGALARDIAVLTACPDVAWTTSRALDLLPDGSAIPHPDGPEHGRLARGTVLRHWLSHEHRLPVHPATLCMRRHLVIALGGWMALPASEDTGLLLAAGSVSTGYFIAATGLLYRKWPGQATGQAAHHSSGERDDRTAIIEARALALYRSEAASGPAGDPADDPAEPLLASETH